MEDAQLTRLIPFLLYLAIGYKGGSMVGSSSCSFADELQSLNVRTVLERENNGADFEAAVKRKFDELRAANKMPSISRGGRVTLGGGGGGSTLWSRMGLGSQRG